MIEPRPGPVSLSTACDTATFATLATMGRCPFVVGVARSVFVANVANVASPTLKKREARVRLATARYMVEVCGRAGQCAPGGKGHDIDGLHEPSWNPAHSRSN